MILVDVGNTDTVIARLAAPQGPSKLLRRVPTPRAAAAADSLAAEVADLAAGAPAEAVGVCAVVPAVAAALLAAVPAAAAVDHTWDFPFAVAVQSPQTVGADRWCNVAAAMDAGWADALVVDAGTATTIDVLEAGVFTGGLIAPGMAFAARQLQQQASQLWEVPFAPCPLAPGRDTASALQAGAFHVGIHGVAGTVGALQVAYRDARVVLCGGLGRFLRRPGWHHDPDWTFRGLAALLLRRDPAAR